MNTPSRYGAWRGIYMTVCWLCMLFGIGQGVRSMQNAAAVRRVPQQQSVLTSSSAQVPVVTFSRQSPATEPTSQTGRAIISPKTAAPSEPLEAGPPPNPIKLATIEPTSGSSHDYSITISECHRSSQIVYCSGVLKNVTDAAANFIILPWRPYTDDQGNSGVTWYAGFTPQFLRGDATIYPDTPVKYYLEIHDPHQNATTISLEVAVAVGPQTDKFFFKDVPIQ